MNTAPGKRSSKSLPVCRERLASFSCRTPTTSLRGTLTNLTRASARDGRASPGTAQDLSALAFREKLAELLDPRRRDLHEPRIRFHVGRARHAYERRRDTRSRAHKFQGALRAILQSQCVRNK